MALNISTVIKGALTIIIGLVLLPVAANFNAVAKANSQIAAISGLTSVLDLIMYGFGFGLVGIGIAMIYFGR